jgi:hypothetical protein
VLKTSGDEAESDVKTRSQFGRRGLEQYIGVAVLGFTSFRVGDGGFDLKVANSLIFVLLRKGKP